MATSPRSSKAASSTAARAKAPAEKASATKVTATKVTATKAAPAKAASTKAAAPKAAPARAASAKSVSPASTASPPSRSGTRSAAAAAPAKTATKTATPAAAKAPAAKAPAVKAAAAKAAAAKAPATKAPAAAAPAAKDPASTSSAPKRAAGRQHEAAPVTDPAGGSAAKSTGRGARAAKPVTVSVDGSSFVIAPAEHFDAVFLEQQLRQLVAERASLTGQANRLEDEANMLIEDHEMGDVQFDDESGEGDTMVVERERDLALSAQARQTVVEIDEALERLSKGTYGLSVVSGDPIPTERLKAIPWATLLVHEKAGGIGRR
jgi:RNA polymerase-binding transcription factor DksA